MEISVFHLRVFPGYWQCRTQHYVSIMHVTEIFTYRLDYAQNKLLRQSKQILHR